MEAIKVNLIPNGIPEACHASQYDEGRQIRLDLFDGLTPYTIQAGDTFKLNVRKPDNHVITETVSGTAGNTYLVIDTTEQMTAVTGENLCEIRVENDGDNIGSLNFIMQVEKDVIANGIPSESVIEDLQELIDEAIGDNYYNKSETDALLAQKADVTDLLDLLPTDNASGALANFTDGADNVPVKALSVEFAASQNLHGQSAPYPAGGSRNKWAYGDQSVTGTYKAVELTTPLPAGTYTLSAKISSTYTTVAARFRKADASALVAVTLTPASPNRSSAVVELTEPAYFVYLYSANGQSGYTATWSDIQLESGNQATDYVPYSNICPITPVNTINVTRTGKNLLNKSAYSFVNVNNIIWGGSAQGAPDGTFKLKAGNYVFSVSVSCNGLYVIGESGNIAVKYNSTFIAFTIDEEKAIKLMAYKSGVTQADILSYNYQLEVGSTATAYEAYNGVTKTLNLGGDYYGGEVDALSGEITENYGKIVFDGSQANTEFAFYTQNDKNRIAWTPYQTLGKVGSKAFKSDKLATSNSYVGMPDEWTVANSGEFVARCFIGVPNTITSVADWQAYVTSNPITLLYEVATPAIEQASNAIELNTLLGDNNIFSDAGDVDVTIRADIALYIQKMLDGNVNRSLGANPSILRTGAISTDIEVREPVEPDSEPVELEREVDEQPENEGNDNEER